MKRVSRGGLALAVTLVASLLAGSAPPAVSSTSTGAFASDDFNSSTLASRWSVVDAKGDGSVSLVGAGSGQAVLELALPGGVSHDAWGSNRSLRVLQAASNTDFEVEAGFDSLPSARYQMQGLLIEQDADDWLRFDVYHDGSQLRGFAAATTAGSSKAKLNQAISAAGTVALRVKRAGDTWTLGYAPDGGSFIALGSFTHALGVTKLGPFVANHHTTTSSVPAFTARVDYVFDTAAPITPEDGSSSSADTTPPVITNAVVRPSTTSATVTWTTDEPATSAVAYGASSAYEDGTIMDDSLTTSHSVTLDGLAPATTYHYRITSTDSAANTATTPDATFTTLTDSKPVIDVWDGTERWFGSPGRSQNWVNILGNVSDRDGIEVMAFTLNGGSSRGLKLGPDNRRLSEPGDFNAEIGFDELVPGTNEVVISASDLLGNTSTAVVTVHYESGLRTPLPYSLNWGSSPVDQQAQIVDGRWNVAGGNIRTAQLGYDRMVTLGDLDWRNYEVRVPVTVHGFGPGAHSYLSGAPLVGLALRWQGHSRVDAKDTAQPRYWWWPTGAFAWYRWYETTPRAELQGNDGSPTARKATTLSVGTPYMLSAQVQDTATGTAYRFKLWPASEAEPAAWTVALEDDNSPATGAVALFAHHVDASFGGVTVKPLDPASS